MSFRIAKVLALPGELEPNTMYITPSDGEKITITVTSLEGIPFFTSSGYTQAELDVLLSNKVDKVDGKQLSTVDFTNALRDKLNGIVNNATKNDTDAALRNRANHTGTQAISTVSQLQSTLDKKVTWFQGRFVNGAAELNQAMNEIPDQAEVFNSWQRFSHSDSLTFPANVVETTTWAFNTETNMVYNTTNSVTYIGAVSDRYFDEYDLTVKIHSTDNDDDLIGVVIAFYKDPVTGAEHTLSAARSPGGSGILWQLVVNYAQKAPNGYWVCANGSPTVTWGNNAPGNLSKANAEYVNNTPGWGNMGAFQGTDGSTRIRIKRSGNLIEAWTSQWSNPDVLDETTKLTIDLTSDPRLEKFQGERQYGLSAQSQANSYWNVLNFSNPKDMIYDVSTRKAYAYNGTQWIAATDISFDSFEDGTIFSDAQTGKMFYKHPGGLISVLGITSSI